MSIIREALNKFRKYETNLNRDVFYDGQFVVHKKRFECGLSPQNKVSITQLPAWKLPNIVAIEDDEPGYFKFIKQASVKDGEFSSVKQFPLTTKYCETRQEVAEEIIRLLSKNEAVNWNGDEEVYNKEVAEKLFKMVNANAPIEEYVLHTPEDFYSLFRSGDYIVMTAGTMEDIMEEVVDSLQKTLPAELQMCFDSKRALDVCMADIHKLSSVYIQVQALDKRFDTEFGMIQKETLLKPEMTHYYIVNLTE